MTEHEARIAQNQLLFRQVNERIEELAILHEFGDARLGLVCECPNLHCTASIELTAAEYEDLRVHVDRFAIAPDHVGPHVELVVAKNDRYWTVEQTAPGCERRSRVGLGR
jgi:hypothetical protein